MAPVVRIGLWGTFDLEDYGEALSPRIGRAELVRRLPEAQVRAFSPLGTDHPTRFDGGDPPEPLGRYVPERLARLTEELDCVLVGSGDIIHDRDGELALRYGRAAEELTELAPSRFFIDGLGPELEEECPVVWHAVGVPFDVPPQQVGRYREALTGRPYLSVRDEISKRRLEEAGVARGVAVVPDPAVLLPRHLDAEVLDRRLRYLRAIGSYPVRGSGLVVQGSRLLLPWVEELAVGVARIAEDLAAPVVLLETSPARGDGEFAAALSLRVEGPVHRVSEVGVEDVAALIAGSGGFVGDSLHGNVTAFAFGRPHAALGLNGDPTLEGFARLIEAEACLARKPQDVAPAFHRSAELGHRADVRTGLQARVDRHFDRLADVARQAAGRRVRPDVAGSPSQWAGHLAALRRAFEARGRRLAIQRWRLADRVGEVERLHGEVSDKAERLEVEVSELRAANTALEEEAAARRAEVERLESMRTFRYTKPFRDAWGRIRRRGGQS
jgi:polysaccharide pyruvyl transferase WcaK-like protein